MFELELSWVGQGKENQMISSQDLFENIVNDGKHEKVPTHIFEDAEKYAKVINIFSW